MCPLMLYKRSNFWYIINNTLEEIKLYEEKLSYEPDKIVEILMTLKNKTMIYQIEKAAKYLKFDVHRRILLQSEDVAKLGTNKILYLKFREYADCYLLCGIVDEELKYWLATLM